MTHLMVTNYPYERGFEFDRKPDGFHRWAKSFKLLAKQIRKRVEIFAGEVRAFVLSLLGLRFVLRERFLFVSYSFHRADF